MDEVIKATLREQFGGPFSRVTGLQRKIAARGLK
jgi:hypothetical protein